jgi:hypothetical protein
MDDEKIKEDLLILIEDFLNQVEKVCQIFSEEFNTDNSELWRIPFMHKKRIGSIPHRGISRYAFHGIGLAVTYMTEKIDFDFYSIDEKCQNNGFDSWVLSLFAQNKKTKYAYFLEQGNVETALNYLKQEAKIVKTQDKTSNLWVLK